MPLLSDPLQIFSTYGVVQKIHVFERDGRTVALVQYGDVRTADTARAALEGHAMYDGGHNVVRVGAGLGGCAREWGGKGKRLHLCIRTDCLISLAPFLIA